LKQATQFKVSRVAVSKNLTLGDISDIFRWLKVDLVVGKTPTSDKRSSVAAGLPVA